MVNDEKALSTAFSRLHDKADLVRVLEKRIVDDHLAGFSATQISKRNECTCKRVKRVIGCYLIENEGFVKVRLEELEPDEKRTCCDKCGQKLDWED